MIKKFIRPPKSETIQPFPEFVKKINGLPYIIEKNPLKISEMSFCFYDGPPACRLKLGTEFGSFSLPVGLNNIYEITPVGRFGLLPEGNLLALRGKWVGNKYFSLDFHSIGTVERPEMFIFFSENSIRIRVNWTPGNLQMTYLE